jgi:8-oxo-dGTP pyrophosphatase MutT (NUDIX family)
MTETNIGLVDMELANSFTKKAAMVLAFNQGKVLAVSRKNDTTKFGLAGGKVDPGETYLEAAIRECYEETGLEAFCAIPIFSRMEPGDVDFFAVVYLVQWKGEIHTTSEKETGKVKWASWEELEEGPFGDYNKALRNHLIQYGLL